MDNEDFAIISPGESVDACYGLETFELELKHINALMEGKQLYTTVNCGEYAIIVKYKDDNNMDFKETKEKLKEILDKEDLTYSDFILELLSLYTESKSQESEKEEIEKLKAEIKMYYLQRKLHESDFCIDNGSIMPTYQQKARKKDDKRRISENQV